MTATRDAYFLLHKLYKMETNKKKKKRDTKPQVEERFKRIIK